jgi:hypothetical protein
MVGRSEGVSTVTRYAGAPGLSRLTAGIVPPNPASMEVGCRLPCIIPPSETRHSIPPALVLPLLPAISRTYTVLGLVMFYGLLFRGR